MILSNNCSNSFIQAHPTSFSLHSNCQLPKKNQRIQTFNMMYLDKITCLNHVKEIKIYKKLSSNSSIFVIRKHIKIFLLFQNIQLTSIFVITHQAQVSLSLSSTTLDPSLDKVEASSSSSSSTKQKLLPLRCYLYYGK